MPYHTQILLRITQPIKDYQCKIRKSRILKENIKSLRILKNRRKDIDPLVAKLICLNNYLSSKHLKMNKMLAKYLTFHFQLPAFKRKNLSKSTIAAMVTMMICAVRVFKMNMMKKMSKANKFLAKKN